MTMDGGIYDSKYRRRLRKASRGDGNCPPPCATTWPNGACIVKGAARGECVCVDPCSALDLPAYDEWGHESLLSGCESCVRHKANSNLRFEGWAMEALPTLAAIVEIHVYRAIEMVPRRTSSKTAGMSGTGRCNIAIVANQRPRRSLGVKQTNRLIPTGTRPAEDSTCSVLEYEHQNIVRLILLTLENLFGKENPWSSGTHVCSGACRYYTDPNAFAGPVTTFGPHGADALTIIPGLGLICRLILMIMA